MERPRHFPDKVNSMAFTLRSILRFQLINQFIPAMFFRTYTIVLGVFCAVFGTNLNAQGFGVVVDSAEVSTGQTVCLPVRALGFTDMLSFQYSLTWNEQVLTFDHTQNYSLPGWESGNFGPIAPGRLLVGWADVDGLPRTKADGSVLYEVCFKVIGGLGNSTLISPGTEGFPPASGGAEAYNIGFQNIWNPNLSFPGLVEITSLASIKDTRIAGDQAFQLSPNPTQSASALIFKADKNSTATLLVTDPAGRTVLEKKVAVKVGENRIEIPAQALKAKGVYQVTLKNGQQVASEILSVN